MAVTDIAKQVLGWLKEWGEKLAQPAPPRYVTIGTVSRHNKVAASIRAEVKHPWQRWHQPDVETFLGWVRLGPVYCNDCKSTMARWDDHQGREQGRRCYVCGGSQIPTGDLQWLALQLTGEPRAHYGEYWAQYQRATASWLDSSIVKTWVKWRTPQGIKP
jgi:hypothetical protein